MTTTSVPAHIVLPLCQKAKEKILKSIISLESCLPEANVTAFGPHEVISSLYKQLNYVARLEEFCLIGGAHLNSHLVKIDLSLEDYSKLILCVDPDKKYSTKNPYKDDN